MRQNEPCEIGEPTVPGEMLGEIGQDSPTRAAWPAAGLERKPGARPVQQPSSKPARETCWRGDRRRGERVNGDEPASGCGDFLARRRRFGFGSLVPVHGGRRADQESATAKPRATAGRAIIPAYQRATFGKSARSTLCRSWRQAQPRMAKSAIESAPAK